MTHAIDDCCEVHAKKPDDGHDGTRETEQEPIPFDPLEAIPWARRTAQEEERRR